MIQVAGMKNFQPPPDYSGLKMIFLNIQEWNCYDVVFFYRYWATWETKIAIQG